MGFLTAVHGQSQYLTGQASCGYFYFKIGASTGLAIPSVSTREFKPLLGCSDKGVSEYLVLGSLKQEWLKTCFQVQ